MHEPLLPRFAEGQKASILMPNPFVKGWKYLTAAMEQAIDENASPEVQISQAVSAAKAQHQKIFDQAAVMAGNRHQLEMKLDRMRADRDRLEDQARQALNAADQAAASGDESKSVDLAHTAEIFASQLVSVEQQLEETVAAHKAAVSAAEQAQKQVAESDARLKETLAEAEKLRGQVTQANMQEATMAADDRMQQLSVDDSVPTLDSVRAKIEARYANALGAQELVESTIGDQMAGIVKSGNDLKASARLEEIRAQLGAAKAGELTSGAGKDGAGVEDAEVEEDSESTDKK
ncbi:PspA/IM30 family protein [Corynebacterium aquilae]|uniref:PspA/IM30 family protein n=1 Tax=Corynebacterium aquilae TaxID=203263 RepID=UPI001B800B13|nr:PspA/IM30 family protein [Corynebacterium aquilae]